MPANINYTARVLAANAMSASVQYLTQRTYLNDITINEITKNALSAIENRESGNIQWIKITQVGRQINASMHQYFSTMQKILFSCYAPHHKQFLLQC